MRRDRAAAATTNERNEMKSEIIMRVVFPLEWKWTQIYGWMKIRRLHKEYFFREGPGNLWLGWHKLP